MNIRFGKLLRTFALPTLMSAGLLGASCAVHAQTPPPVGVRGAITAVSGDAIQVRTNRGEDLTVKINSNTQVRAVTLAKVSDIKPGSYIGTAAMPAADGALTALEVLVFPEAARGTGEGHVPWDLQPGSTMTNATVAEVTAVPQGRSMKLRYKDGEKTVTVPENVPIVTFSPGHKGMIVPGAKVLVTSQVREGKAVAVRALVGKDGLVPPM